MTVVSKALTKAGRFFEANGLDGCSKIANSVKAQVRTNRTVSLNKLEDWVGLFRLYMLTLNNPRPF